MFLIKNPDKLLTPRHYPAHVGRIGNTQLGKYLRIIVVLITQSLKILPFQHILQIGLGMKQLHLGLKKTMALTAVYKPRIPAVRTAVM